MAYKFLDSVGLSHVFEKIKVLLSDKANNDHTHSYAGSASVGGAANSAVKLQTARKINGVNFDGTENINIDTGVTSVNGTTGAVTLKDYVTGLSVNGKTITYTKKDGTSGTITTQDTTYSAATNSSAGLMSADEHKKLSGIAAGANAYTLPTASSTLGGVKTTSTVTSTDGLTACPIIGGVPYYKDTKNTYNLGSFSVTATAAELNVLDGITATTAELNYCDGVTSNIQTQLNGKLSTSGTAAKATADASGNTITSTYETKANAITGLSVSGKTITYTKGNGTTGTITTQDTNTTYTAMTASEATTGTATTARTITAKVLNDKINEKLAVAATTAEMDAVLT